MTYKPLRMKKKRYIFSEQINHLHLKYGCTLLEDNQPLDAFMQFITNKGQIL